MSATLTAPIAVEREPRFVLRNVGYGQYVTIADALPERRDVRLVYVDGRLTFLAPSRIHDWHAECLGDIVKAVASGCGIRWEPAGSATYRREDSGAGVEGGRTYYFGANAGLMRGPVNIDLSTQPPPDLAIEVEATHPADDSVVAWGRIGVPEVWRFDAPRWALSFWLRRDDGTYGPIDRSLVLPGLAPSDVLEQLRLADELGTSLWFVQLAGWVRDVIAPRMGGA